MIAGIVTNLESQKGLYRDAVILARTLKALGHEARLFDWLDRDIHIKQPRSLDLLIFCEVLEPVVAFREMLRMPHGQVWYKANPEWHVPAKDLLLRYVDRVLCKTQDAFDRGRWSGKQALVGFESEDIGPPVFEPGPQFLHPAGGSICRGTAAVLRAWICAQQLGVPKGARLVVVDPPSSGEVKELIVKAQMATPDRFTVYERMPEDRFREIQRASAVHVIGSEYEGWGHLFWEALGLGAHVLGTDGPWWSAAAGCFTPIESLVSGTRCLATQRVILSRSLATEMARVSQSPVLGHPEARACFERARTGFRSSFADLVTTVKQEDSCRT